MSDKNRNAGGIRITASVNMKEDYQKLLEIIELVDNIKELVPDYLQEEAETLYKELIGLAESMIIVSEE